MIPLVGLRNRKVVPQRSAGELDAMATAGAVPPTPPRCWLGSGSFIALGGGWDRLFGRRRPPSVPLSYPTADGMFDTRSRSAVGPIPPAPAGWEQISAAELAAVVDDQP
jgi:hypothetical protein